MLLVFLLCFEDARIPLACVNPGSATASPLLFAALVLIVVIPHSASGQATATLNGVVRDPSGAVLPQATVTLHNTDTGTERESRTNDSGLYVFVSVPPGEYVLKVAKDGFTTATQGDCMLSSIRPALRTLHYE